MLTPLLQEKARENGLPFGTMIAEVLHLIVLNALFAVPESQAIRFQGGTSIHLLYGGYRYSEDLGFAGESVTPSGVQRLVARSQSNVEKGIVQYLGPGTLEWRLPEFLRARQIHTVWLLFRPQSRRQKYRLKLEFAEYPTYEPTVLPVQSDLDVLGRRPLVTGLSQRELLAARIAAVTGRSYLKGRDLFDLWYLSEVLGTEVDSSMVRRKLRDYGVDVSKSKLDQRLHQLRTEDFTAEMDRFLPRRYRQQLQEDGYGKIRESAAGTVLRAIGGIQ